jgi:hypothetical protein
VLHGREEPSDRCRPTRPCGAAGVDPTNRAAEVLNAAIT